jgi:arylamine N-acetyltransferase
MDAPACSRYLRLLGVEEPVAGLEGLRRIVSAHVCCVPFENVTKLLLMAREGQGRITQLDEFLDGIEHHDLGGTCYTSNPFLWQLLRALGFDADLLGAEMSAPDVHTCLRVRLDGCSYHVDAGYGAPLREPVRLDDLPWDTAAGRLRYVLHRRNGDGRLELSDYVDESRVYGYLVRETPRNPEYFRDIVLDSFQPGMHFLTRLRIVRVFTDHVVELHNRMLQVHRGDSTTTVELRSMRELKSVVALQLAMPRCPVEQAVQSLEALTGSPFFG